MLVLLGITQLGLIFNAYVTVANAAREGARAGSIWVADPNSQGTNDSATARRTSDSVVNGSLGFLAPADATTTVGYASGSTACKGTAGDPRRKDWCVIVNVDYDLVLFIPFIADIIGSGNSITISAESQMVVN